jgi:hypothetical protein
MGWEKVVCNGCQARVMVAAGEAIPDACPDCGDPMGRLSATDSPVECAALTTPQETAPAAPSLWNDLKQLAVSAAPHVARVVAIVGAEALRHTVKAAAERKKAEIQTDHQWAAAGEVARNVGPAAVAGAALGGAVGYLTGGTSGALKTGLKQGYKGVKAALHENPDAIEGPFRRHREEAAGETRNVDNLADCADAMLRAVQAFAASGEGPASQEAPAANDVAEHGIRVMRTNADTHSPDGACTNCEQADEVSPIESCSGWYWCNRCGKSFEADAAPPRWR